MTDAICECCGKEFSRTPNHIKKYKQHFCSRQCYFKTRYGPNTVNPSYEGQKAFGVMHPRIIEEWLKP